jgi:hypothetical protein
MNSGKTIYVGANSAISVPTGTAAIVGSVEEVISHDIQQINEIDASENSKEKIKIYPTKDVCFKFYQRIEDRICAIIDGNECHITDVSKELFKKIYELPEDQVTKISNIVREHYQFLQYSRKIGGRDVYKLINTIEFEYRDISNGDFGSRKYTISANKGILSVRDWPSGIVGLLTTGDHKINDHVMGNLLKLLEVRHFKTYRNKDHIWTSFYHPKCLNYPITIYFAPSNFSKISDLRDKVADSTIKEVPVIVDSTIVAETSAPIEPSTPIEPSLTIDDLSFKLINPNKNSGNNIATTIGDTTYAGSIGDLTCLHSPFYGKVIVSPTKVVIESEHESCENILLISTKLKLTPSDCSDACLKLAEYGQVDILRAYYDKGLIDKELHNKCLEVAAKNGRHYVVELLNGWRF